MRAGPFMSGVAWLYVMFSAPAHGGGADARAVLPPVQYQACDGLLPLPEPVPVHGPVGQAPTPGNTFMLDGAQITDPVTGTYSTNFDYAGVRSPPSPSAPGPDLAGQVLTQDILHNLPTGRSYQSAAAVVPGGNPEPTVANAPARAVPADRPATAGRSLWLSNDDPTSLASAQLALRAARGGRFPALDEIRPHELLNAWPWSPAGAPTDGFAVRGAARRFSEGQLTVGLTVSAATPPARPHDVTLVVDRSGSMSPYDRLRLVQRAMRRLVAHLSPGDRVDVVVFDDQVCTPVRGFVLGRDDPRTLLGVINGIQPRGATDLHTGLRVGYEIARYNQKTPGRNQRVMVFTDADLNTGVVDPAISAQVAGAAIEQGIALTGVGVGYGLRDDVLDRMTEEGRGAYVFLASEMAADELFGPRLAGLLETAAVDVRYRVDLPDGVSLRRFYGEEWGTRPRDVRPVHATAGTTQLFLSDFVAGPDADGEALTLVIQWRDPLSDVRREQRVELPIAAMLAASDHELRAARALIAWAAWMQEGASGLPACGEAAGVLRHAIVAAPAGMPWVEDLRSHVDRLCPRGDAWPVSGAPPSAPPNRVVGEPARVPATSALAVSVIRRWPDGSALWPDAIGVHDRRPRCGRVWDPSRCR